jgi:phospholipase/carboxylesterase
VLSGAQKLPKSGKDPQQLIVLLHGYGADGANLIDLAEYWADSLPHAEFIAPNAPEPCDINLLGYQWFGLSDFSPANVRQGIDRAVPILKKYLLSLLVERHMSPTQLALVGFSQGTIMALEMIFHLPGLKSVVGYSGAFYPPPSKNLTLPYPEVFLAHGDMDTVVPYPALEWANKQLQQLGVVPHTHTCKGLGHSIDAEGAVLGGQFLTHVFASSDSVIYMDQK